LTPHSTPVAQVHLPRPSYQTNAFRCVYFFCLLRCTAATTNLVLRIPHYSLCCFGGYSALFSALSAERLLVLVALVLSYLLTFSAFAPALSYGLSWVEGIPPKYLQCSNNAPPPEPRPQPVALLRRLLLRMRTATTTLLKKLVKTTVLTTYTTTKTITTTTTVLVRLILLLPATTTSITAITYRLSVSTNSLLSTNSHHSISFPLTRSSS
jgi:hypothetical protein